MPRWFVVYDAETGVQHKEGPLDDNGFVFGAELQPDNTLLISVVMEDKSTRTYNPEEGCLVKEYKQLDYAAVEGLQWDATLCDYVARVPDVPEEDPAAALDAKEVKVDNKLDLILSKLLERGIITQADIDTIDAEVINGNG